MEVVAIALIVQTWSVMILTMIEDRGDNLVVEGIGLDIAVSSVENSSSIQHSIMDR
jgi:hypothetical protein